MRRIDLSAHLMGCVVLATFIPFKVYPVIYFLVSAVFFFSGSRRVINLPVLPIILFISYACGIYLWRLGENDDASLSIIKLIVCGTLLASLIQSNFSRNEVLGGDKRFLLILEKYLRWILVLCLLQVILLQLQSGGIRFKAQSSYDAGLMFSDHFIFWGVDDKNIFGAKLALFGFLHSLIRYKLKGKVEYHYATIYLLASILTLSRTAVLFSISVFVLLVLYSFRAKKIYFFLIPVALVVGRLFYPYIADLVRVDSITNGNMDDGMGIRLVYWRTFFENFESISFWGNGIASAKNFLAAHGELMSGQNLHNIFFNIYLDMGWIGILLYSIILFSIFKSGFNASRVPLQVIIMAIPFLMMVNTLYTPYDNDVWVYLMLMYVISISYDFNSIKRSERARV